MQFFEGKQELVIQYKYKKYLLSACQMEGLPKVYRGYREKITRAQPMFQMHLETTKGTSHKRL